MLCLKQKFVSVGHFCPVCKDSMSSVMETPNSYTLLQYILVSRLLVYTCFSDTTIRSKPSPLFPTSFYSVDLSTAL